MNEAEGEPNIVTALLPSGIPIKVEVTGPAAGSGMTSVGVRDHLDIGIALDTVSELGSIVVEKLKAAKPTRATVELKLGFAVEAGKLTSLLVTGSGDASLTITLEWSEKSAQDD